MAQLTQQDIKPTWITHDGTSPPQVDDGRLFYVMLRDDLEEESACLGDYSWLHVGSGQDVVAYWQPADNLPACPACGWLSGGHSPGCHQPLYTAPGHAGQH